MGKSKVNINYKLKVEKETRSIDKILKQINKKVPDYLKKIGNEYGEVVIFEGKLTDLESMVKYQGEHPPHHPEDSVWDDLPGAYSSTYREAYIQQNYSKSSHGSVSLELHEYGHLIDDALNKISDDKEFLTIHEKSKERNESYIFSKLGEPEKEEAGEFFAESFAMFYHGKFTKRKLKRNFPEAYQFFFDLRNKGLKIF